jgi:hypothetical protein
MKTVLLFFLLGATANSAEFPVMNKSYKMVCDLTPNDPDYLILNTTENHFHLEYSDSESQKKPGSKIHHRKNFKIENVTKLLGVENHEDFPGRTWHFEKITFSNNSFEDEFYLLINGVKKKLEEKTTITFANKTLASGMFRFEYSEGSQTIVMKCPFIEN